MAGLDTNPKLQILLERLTSEYCQLWEINSIKQGITIKFSNRIKRSLGKTQPAAKIIRLNPVLQTQSKGLLKEVLCHELAHIAAHHLHCDSIRPHGPEWQALVRAVGYEPSVRIEVDLGVSPADQTKCYTHYCPICHAVRMAKKPMTRWRCAECVANGLSGDLEIEGEK